MRRFLLLVVSLAVFNFLSAQTIKYVNSNASGANNGTSWMDAFVDLQSGIDAASAGDTLWVAAGSYIPSSTPSFALKSGVVVLGGFADTTTLLSSRNWGVNQTILSTGAYTMVNTNVDNTAILDGFMFNASYIFVGNGSFISNNAASPTIINCVFYQGIVSGNGNGGAIANENGSSPHIINCVFLGNTAAGNAGAIYNNASSPVIINCTFDRNSTGDGNTSGGAGGAIENENAASPVITNCIFWGNTDDGSGADIYNDGTSTSTVTYCYTQTSIAGMGNITETANPFVNESYGIGNDGLWMTGDDGFALSYSSAALNAGTPDTAGLGLPQKDIAGNNRIIGNAIDMGAYETSLAVLPPGQKVIYVNINNTNGTYNGASWATALTDLQLAIGSASAGDSIWVATGSYNPTGNSFTMKNGIVLLGGFNGTETSADMRNWNLNQTQLNSDYNSPAIISNNLDSTAVIDGFYFDGYNFSVGAAAISNNASSPTIQNCYFTTEVEDNSGSTIDNENGSSPKITNCFFYNNSSLMGGNITVENNASSPVFTNCVFSSNWGPVNNENGASPVFTNCTFSNNSNTIITNQTNTTATITNCVFWGNNNDISDDGSTTTNITYSYTQNPFAGTGNIQGTVDPFVNDANPFGNDGFRMTGDDGLFLSTASTALNAGTPDTTGLRLPLTDIVGNPRIGFGRIDMGAYEIEPVTKLYVDAAYGSDANSGAYWSQSLQTFNQALLIANADTIVKAIYLTGGDYVNTGNSDSSFTIYRGGLKIYGGYPSGGGTRDLINNTTYLQGNNSNHVLVIAGIDANADSLIIDGVTVQYGGAGGTGTYTYNGITIDQSKGAGIVIANAGTSGKLLINGCIINGNHAVNGGGVYVYQSIPIFTNCVISGNLADENGGGIYQSTAYSGELNCTFSGNNAIDSGGAIYNDGNAFSIMVNNIVWGNSSGISDNGQGSLVEYSVVQDSGYAGGQGIINSDPFFTNAPAFSTAPFINGNYHLSPCKISPAYNTGDSVDFAQYAGNTDIEGNPRISLGGLDMGAYEIQATPTNVPTAVYVDSANGNDANLGDSWAHSFKTLNYALSQVNSGTCTDSILVAKGTYYPTGIQSGTDRHSYFIISRTAIKLLGGYDAATGLRDIINNATYLDGDIGVAGDSTDNSYHVMIIVPDNNYTDSTIIDGFTIRNGNANIVGDDEYHNGAIYRSDYGGGINLNGLYYNPVAIRNCIFTHNSSTNGGGGSDFENSGHVNILNCTYAANTSSRGAGYYSYSCNGFVSGCTFTSNYTTAGGAGGAGMYCLYGSYNLIDCIFNGNYSSTNGGGINMTNASGSRILNCLFSGNVAVQSGGGIYGGAQPVLDRIVNCTFSGNKAASAGAIYVGNSGSLIMSSCVLYGNSSSMDNTYAEIQSSDIEGGYTGSGSNNLNVDPLFVDAPSYSTAPFTGGNYKLLACSPAIETGNTQYIGENSSFFVDTANHDLGGTTRLIGQTFDMGAYEFDPTGLPVPTTPGTYQSSLSMTDANTNITHFYSCGNLLLSMNLTGSGALIPANGVKVQVGTGATYYPNGTGFVNNASGSVLYNRQWQVTPTTEPTNPVTVYDYYTADDYNNVNDTLIAHALNPLLAETQMYFYKVTDNGLGDFPAIETTLPSTVQIITNSTTPSLTEWVSGTTTGGNKYGAFLVSSFSGGGGGGNPPMVLAVQLLSFTGKTITNYNALNWQMAATKEVSYFEVERSSNGIDFTSISNQQASILQTTYNYNDVQPLQGNNYYRIKIVATDGSIRYSKIVKLNNAQSGNVTVYPVPAINTVTVTNTNTALNNKPVNIIDMQGRILFSFIMKGSNAIDISKWAAGMYILNLEDGETVRIVKAL